MCEANVNVHLTAQGFDPSPPPYGVLRGRGPLAGTQVAFGYHTPPSP